MAGRLNEVRNVTGRFRRLSARSYGVWTLKFKVPL